MAHPATRPPPATAASHRAFGGPVSEPRDDRQQIAGRIMPCLRAAVSRKQRSIASISPATVVKGSTMFPRDRVIASLTRYSLPFAPDAPDAVLREHPLRPERDPDLPGQQSPAASPRRLQLLYGFQTVFLRRG